MMPRCGAPHPVLGNECTLLPDHAAPAHQAYIGGATPGLYIWADVPLCKARRASTLCAREEGHDGRHQWTGLDAFLAALGAP